MAVKINISKICIISSFVVMIFGILAYSYQKTVKIEAKGKISEEKIKHEKSEEIVSVEAYGDTTIKLTKERTIQLANLYDSLKNK